MKITTTLTLDSGRQIELLPFEENEIKAYYQSLPTPLPLRNLTLVQPVAPPPTAPEEPSS